MAFTFEERGRTETIEARIELVHITGFSRGTKKEIESLLKEIGLEVPYHLTIRPIPLIERAKVAIQTGGKRKPVGAARTRREFDDFIGYNASEIWLHEARFKSLTREQRKMALVHELAHLLDLTRPENSGLEGYTPMPLVEWRLLVLL